MADKFTEQFKKQLGSWIGGNKKTKFTLLYKATRDGCTSTAFHNQCNNKGATVTVLYNTNNTVFGGYTSVSWHSNEGYSNDAKAFLFRLNYNGTFQPVQFPAKTATNAINGNASYGPIFGANDLNCFSGTVNMTGNYYPLNGSASLGTSYDMKGENYNTFANGHLQVLDVEVYGAKGILFFISISLSFTRVFIQNVQNFYLKYIYSDLLKLIQNVQSFYLQYIYFINTMYIYI